MHEFDYFIPLFVTHIRGMHIVVTPDLIFKILHVPRVSHPDYLGYDHLRIVSKDELMSLLCETPSSWSDCQNTRYLTFAKGLRFLTW